MRAAEIGQIRALLAVDTRFFRAKMAKKQSFLVILALKSEQQRPKFPEIREISRKKSLDFLRKFPGNFREFWSLLLAF